MSLDNPRLVIDRKANLGELCQNVCQQHERFVNELKRAAENNIKVIILCEHSGKIQCLADVFYWENPRLKVNPHATTGEQLYKILCTIQNKYNTDFIFCKKKDTGEKIIELLKNNK